MFDLGYYVAMATSLTLTAGELGLVRFAGAFRDHGATHSGESR
jgi:hypothetical protein